MNPASLSVCVISGDTSPARNAAVAHSAVLSTICAVPTAIHATCT